MGKKVYTKVCIYHIHIKIQRNFFAFVSWICFVCSPWSRFSVFTNVAIGKKAKTAGFQDIFIVPGIASGDSYAIPGA